jgi:hypothetical protein
MERYRLDGRHGDHSRTLFQGQKVLPKNGRFHQLMMTPPLRACLESVYLQRQVERPEGSGKLPSWVFCSEQGTPIDGHNLRARWWKPLLDAAQLPPIRLHDLRGSVVSLLLNEGLTPWEVQSYIGHRSLVIPCNTYGHRYPGSSRVGGGLGEVHHIRRGETASDNREGKVSPALVLPPTHREEGLRGYFQHSSDWTACLANSSSSNLEAVEHGQRPLSRHWPRGVWHWASNYHPQPRFTRTMKYSKSLLNVTRPYGSSPQGL